MHRGAFGMTAMAMQLCAMSAPSDHQKPVLRKGEGATSEERLTWHFQNWAEWQMRENTLGQGAPKKAGSGLGRTHRTTFDDMVDSADTRCAEAVEAALDDCTPLERFSVHHEHLAAVYRFPRAGADHARLYANAREKVKRGLGRRGIV